MKEKDTIDNLRKLIDDLDKALAKLLNERAKLAIRIGNVKKELGLEVYSPEREEEIMRNVEALNMGPLSTAAIKRLFERIIDESRALERDGMKDIAARKKPGRKSKDD